MNCLLGQKLSIVTPKAQTTRHKILGIDSGSDYQMVFMDTPGIIQNMRNRLEERMMAAVRVAARDADAIITIVDATDRPREDAEALEQPTTDSPIESSAGSSTDEDRDDTPSSSSLSSSSSDRGSPPRCLVLNKVDQLPSTEIEPMVSWFRKHSNATAVIPVSAKGGVGVEALRTWLVSVLPEGPTLYPRDYVAQAPERFFVSEIIREKIFEQYDQEIPYGCQVNVVEFKERPVSATTGKDRIRAEILVERKGHRGILLGREGSAIKRLSTSSRLDIETFLGRPVYLELTIKEDKGWRNNDTELSKLGY